MGLGAQGWHGDDGPNPLCAWSREQLGWIGRDNDRLIEVLSDATDLRLADLHRDGVVYKIPLGIEMLQEGIYRQVGTGKLHPYLLLEHRLRDGHHYNRNLPAEGLLVWHVNPLSWTNDVEANKLVDLVCADGLYADAAFPLGTVVEKQLGGDNLDFWAHDNAYTVAHRGNEGDATDPFDGIHYTRLAPSTNPSSNFGGRLPAAMTGLILDNMRRQGEFMTLDVVVPRWAGTIREEIHWTSEVLVDGDLTIAPQGKLVVHGAAQVLFAEFDRLQSGRDLARCEVHIQGEFRLEPKPILRHLGGRQWEHVGFESIPFASQVPGQTWYGIYADASARVRIPEGGFKLSGAEYGFLLLADQPPALRADPATAVLENSETRPTAVELLPNYPNPFNPETTIRFNLLCASQVRLVIYNALGQVIRTLADGFRPAGMHEMTWDGRNDQGREVASGIYLYSLELAGAERLARQMALVK